MKKVRAKVAAIISPTQAIADRLKEGRKKAGLTQAQLADKAKLARSSVINYEQGNAAPGALELIKLAHALQLSPNFILSGSADFFPSGALEHALVGDDMSEIALKVALCLTVIGRESAEPVSALLMTMARQKLSKKEFAVFMKAQMAFKDSLPDMAAKIENVAESVAPKVAKRMQE